MSTSQLSEKPEIVEKKATETVSSEKEDQPTKVPISAKYRLRFRQFLQVIDPKSGSRIPKTIRVVKQYNDIEK